MITLKNKYIIGTNVMFYEAEMVKDFIDSVVYAAQEVNNPENITLDFLFNVCEDYEKPSSLQELMRLEKLLIEQVDSISDRVPGCKVKYNAVIGKDYTMVNYRRDLNTTGCKDHDFVIWGESDCLVPQDMFACIEDVSNIAQNNSIHRYITTFAMRKMWDNSWRPLEHVEFEDATYYEKDNPLCWTEQSSIRYTMSREEMNEINARHPNIQVSCIAQPVFDGSCLVISSDLIKAGCNIPLGLWGITVDDTAMKMMCNKIMGHNYRQFIIKNRLKVHNREHPKKRIGAVDSEGSESTQAQKGSWYKEIATINKENLNIIFNRPDQKIIKPIQKNI